MKKRKSMLKVFDEAYSNFDYTKQRRSIERFWFILKKIELSAPELYKKLKEMQIKSGKMIEFDLKNRPRFLKSTLNFNKLKDIK
jgi:hypothetical protein